MLKTVATSVMASAVCLAIAGAAQAQVVIPPGQDFYATPMNKGDMMAMPAAKIAMSGPGGKMMMKRKMMKKKMMMMKKM